jgi:hypothetical protein
MIKFKLSFILTLILLAIAHYLYGKEVINSLLLVYLSMFLLSFILLYLSKKHIKSTISSDNKKFTVGENFQINFNITNKGIFLYPFINFSSDSYTLVEKLETSFTLLPFKKLALKLNHKLSSRGVCTLPRYNLEVKDLFFISSRVLKFNGDVNITVYPKDVQLPLEIQSLLESSSVSSKGNISLYPPDTHSSIDKYIPGDNIKNIHWKVSAKRNDLYVKKFDLINNHNIVMYIDMTDCANLPEAFHNLTDENLVSFSLSMIKYLLWENQIINLTVENLKSDTFQLQNTEDYYTILSYYLEHKNMGKGNFFNKVFEKVLQNIESYKSIFIITYTILPNDIETISRIASTCNNLIIITLLDVEPETKGLLSLIDVNVVTVTI